MDGGGYYGMSGKRAFNDVEDAGERNDKQKKRPGYKGDNTVQVAETEYRILCPVSRIGSLIGKGGSIIKALRTECRSKIKVEDPVSGSDERVVFVSSPSDQIGQNSHYVCAAQEALLKVHGRITDVDYDDEPPQPVTLRLLVAKGHIGCLLGKGGKIIEQMRKDFDAQIRILPKDQQPPSAASTDELVQVTGDASHVRKALFEISTRLHENVTGDRTNRGSYVSDRRGHTVPPMVPASDGMYATSGYLQTGGLIPGAASAGGPVQGLSYGYAGMYGDSSFSNSWGLSTTPVSTVARSRTMGAIEEEFIVQLLCPNSRIGSIIGKGGVIINKMREITGAKIKVEEQVPDCDERIILVSAAEFVDTYPSPVIEAAMQLFRRLVEMQMDKDADNRSFCLRLLVPSTQVGCLIGKGGSIVNEMRKETKANIRISPKDVPCKCAGEGDELVQVMGDQSVVHGALIQVLNRLRSNLFKGQEGVDARPGLGSPLYPDTIYQGSSAPISYKAGPDSGAGSMFSDSNLGYQNRDYGSGGMGSFPPIGKEGRESRWHVRY